MKNAISRAAAIGIIVAVVVIAGVGVYFVTLSSAPTPTTTTTLPLVRVINLTARDFGFDGFIAPGPTIKVKLGETVRINLVNMGGLKHEIVISSSNMVQQTLFNAASDLIGPGKSTSITFVADTAGNFFYACFSDDGVAPKKHAELGMWGEFIVEG